MPGPKLVDHASLARGASWCPTQRSDSIRAEQGQGQAPGHVAGYAFSPPFVASFSTLRPRLYTRTSPRTRCSSTWSLSCHEALHWQQWDYQRRAKYGKSSTAPTAVASNMRKRLNKFGFVSIVKQMVTLLSTGPSTTVAVAVVAIAIWTWQVPHH